MSLGNWASKIFGDLHEDYPDNPENNKKFALHNNYIGRIVGEKHRGKTNAHQLVIDDCYRALFNGTLSTSRHDFDRGNEADPFVIGGIMGA